MATTAENFEAHIPFLQDYYREKVALSADGKPLTITFTEPVENFDAADLGVTGATAANLAPVPGSNGTQWTVELTPDDPRARDQPCVRLFRVSRRLMFNMPVCDS